MSIAAPELQVLIRNQGDKIDSYKVQIRGARQGTVPACDLTRDGQDDSRPGHAEREQLNFGTSASIAPHGFAHRIHAFRGLPTSPCSVEVKLSSTRSAQTLPQTLAILRREISCKEPGPVFWSLLRDVPQGLPSGPAIVPGRGWIGFVSAVEMPPYNQNVNCTAFFDVAYERTPRGFAVIEKVEVPLQEDSGWTWAAPDVKWPE